MKKRPNAVYILILLWLLLAGIFLLWGIYSLSYAIRIPNWQNQIPGIAPFLHFGFTISTIVWFVFSSLFTVFAYSTFRGDSWVWTTGLILSTIFLAIFGLMLASFMITAILFLDEFSVAGLITVVITFLIDLGIVYHLTRPIVKLYFNLIDTEGKKTDLSYNF